MAFTSRPAFASAQKHVLAAAAAEMKQGPHQSD